MQTAKLDTITGPLFPDPSLYILLFRSDGDGDSVRNDTFLSNLDRYLPAIPTYH